ncbi:MAG: TIGR00289 family protein [Archaeoglobi archaeon]|jgi:predicted ATP pyrophosphatase (TIGR00289 family)|nr:MAG: TIGR00289 family protein [Archaeoglobi archaeon]
MRIAVLTSGGKDSILALHKISDMGELLLVTAIPEREDSYMFHTANLHMLDAIAKCLDLPLVKIKVSGIEEKEVEELKEGLSNLEIDAVCCGAIASNYQLSRIKRICDSLDLKLFAPLWGIEQERILNEVSQNFEAVIVSVSAMGLDESFLGMKLDKKGVERLKEVAKKTKINLSGEGGEYETLVLDAPLFKKRIIIKFLEKIWQNNRGVALVKDFEIIEKKR